MATMQQLAQRFSQQFCDGPRKGDDERPIRVVRDDAPDRAALVELIHEAHGWMLPDDIRYRMVEEALDAIAECDEDADEDAIRERLDEIEPPIYTHELTRWLHSRADRIGYVTDAQDEYGKGDDISASLAQGWLFEMREVAASVLESLAALAADDDDEE